MDEEKPIDGALLRRMMMGEFSFTSEDKSSGHQNGIKRNVEIDLHFEKLYPLKAGLTPKEKLNLQLEALEDFILNAKRNSIRSAYVIVGKGEGVLKDHVQKKLNQWDIKHSESINPPYFGNALKVKL